MADVTNEFILERLKAPQAGQRRIEDRLDRIEANIRGLKSYVAMLIEAEARQDGESPRSRPVWILSSGGST